VRRRCDRAWSRRDLQSRLADRRARSTHSRDGRTSFRERLLPLRLLPVGAHETARARRHSARIRSVWSCILGRWHALFMSLRGPRHPCRLAMRRGAAGRIPQDPVFAREIGLRLARRLEALLAWHKIPSQCSTEEPVQGGYSNFHAMAPCTDCALARSLHNILMRRENDVWSV